MPFVTSPTPLEGDQGRHSPKVSFDKPVPRPVRTPSKSRDIRVQNRRREYIERHPEYFSSQDHELADPVLYDTLIRRFQTPAEREEERKRKGYSRVLEGDLLRGEAVLAKLTEDAKEGSSSLSPSRQDFHGSSELASDTPPPADKDQAKERWKEFLIDRFVRGRDEDFNYDGVDFDEEYDSLERRDAEDAWFEDEDPDWNTDPDEKMPGEDTRRAGETGIQDF